MPFCVFFSAVTRACEHKAAPALPGLAGRMAEGAREPGHGQRHRQVADGRRAWRAHLLHYDLQPRDAPLQERQQVQSEIQQQLQNTVKQWKQDRCLSGKGLVHREGNGLGNNFLRLTWRNIKALVSDSSGGWRTSPFISTAFSAVPVPTFLSVPNGKETPLHEV